MFLSDQMRFLVLVLGCALLWSVESIAPLYSLEKDRFRRAIPNIALALILVITNLALSIATAKIAGFVAEKKLGFLLVVNPAPWVIVLVSIAALDLFTYLAHVLLHKSWLGWQFHRVHHSDKEVNVTTAFRQHPGETVWRILWQVLAVAIFGIPLSVVALYLLISTLNAQLEHTNIHVNQGLDRWLRYLFVTPNMHKVHHSREQFQTDSNYSNIFSVWDRIFGTYTPTVDFQTLRYGLDGFDGRDKQTLKALLRLPFATNT
jgi:sterol desaturase/sphingolipid hydroxylase (fatty acid hydroxylase superfamily)